MHQLPICREKETEQEKERERELQSIPIILITNALSDSHHGQMSNCRLCQHQLWILLHGIVAMGSNWQMVLDHLGCRMFPSFIKEEISERVLIIIAMREILRGTQGMSSLSSTFSQQLSQFPKHHNSCTCDECQDLSEQKHDQQIMMKLLQMSLMK